MACLDLTSYFHSLPWTETSSKRFGWFRDPRRDGGVWQFKGKPPEDWPHKDAHLPPYRRYATCSFGLASIPAWASTISGVIAGMLRDRGCSGVTFYIDDFLLVCKTKEECEAQIVIFLALMEELGLGVAADKTLGPAQIITFLGLQLDSLQMEVTITQDRAVSLIQTIEGFLAAGRATRKKLHTLQGKLSWVGMVVRGGRIYIRSIINAVSRTRGRRSSMHIDLDEELTRRT